MLTIDQKENVKRNTALSLDQFEDLLQRLPTLQSLFKSPKNATVALYMYLMKMRTGQPSQDIGRLFSVTRVTVERRMTKVRNAIEEDFVYEHVNYVRNREELIPYNSEMGRRLLCADNPDRVILICDGTYIFINKSQNFQFQKETYTDKKKRNFVKVMMCVTCNGTIYLALAPYSATMNDAKILRSIFEETDSFVNLQNNDVFILDRGFRDVVEFLSNKGFDVKMPALIQRSSNKSQLTTAEANASRLVTALRFVVEARNGHLKGIWKIFSMTWSSIPLKHLDVDVRICAALLNRYFCSIESNKGIADEVSRRMLEKLNTRNEFSDIVKTSEFQENMKNFAQFDDLDSLPILTPLHLIYIALGTYQIKEAASYCQENMKNNGSIFKISTFPEGLNNYFFGSYQVNEQQPRLLHAMFRSRFRSDKKHNTFVLVDTNGQDENAILGYYCSCYSGMRTVGCCAHVMSIIWFALYIKNRNIPKPAAFLDNYFDRSEQ